MTVQLFANAEEVSDFSQKKRETLAVTIEPVHTKSVPIYIDLDKFNLTPKLGYFAVSKKYENTRR